ncbi:MAG TPA: MBL fold metallo-hydrolase [Patescibacteria group bacterium]|nr:MBL fold metallo-hydrolase [Patescibacteria group bacterium]
MKWIVGVIAVLLFLIVAFFAFNNYIYNQKQKGGIMENPSQTVEKSSLIDVTPISHATMVLKMGGQVIYTDPVGGAQIFAGEEAPTLILVTDIHSDHMDPTTLKDISKEDTTIVVPQAVADQLPKDIPGNMVVMKNGDNITEKGIGLEAIPMYNLPESPTAFHTKGRGNGYVISADDKRVYVAGDTDDIPEMRALKNIDVAFIPMNPPYTMDIERAASAVVAFKPKVVHPYHYRTPNGFSDVNKFKELVNAADPSIKVELLNFYPSR